MQSYNILTIYILSQNLNITIINIAVKYNIYCFYIMYAVCSNICLISQIRLCS